MSLKTILNLLQKRIGLESGSLGPTLVPSAVAARMRALGIDDPDIYTAQAEAAPDEFQALVEAIVVPETWFFRGGDLFADLAGRIAERVNTGGDAFRMLSVPCSTGEEPYSLVLALRDRGVAPEKWTVDAIDISRKSLDLARQGRYGALSFRQTSPEIRARHFQAAGSDWELPAELRAGVRFRLGNVVDPQFLQGEAPFDLIMCRNLLIYLDAGARRQTLTNLDRLLAPDGLLCLGHAEPLEPGDRRYQRIEAEGGFLYRRRVAASVPAVVPPPARLSLPTPRPCPAASPPPLLVAAAAPAETTPPDPVAQARDLADAGQLDRALTLCDQVLCGDPSPEAYTLRGVVRQALHKPDEARADFERALYLRPDHAEALNHLMLLYRHQGDLPRAERLARRLRNVKPRGDE